MRLAASGFIVGSGVSSWRSANEQRSAGGARYHHSWTVEEATSPYICIGIASA